MTHSRDLFQNTKRSDYSRHAVHSIDTRQNVALATVGHEAVYGYFMERQEAAYKKRQPFGGTFRFNESPGPLVFPTMSQWRWLERLADYLLAEDNVKGLALRTKAHIEADEDEDCPTMGGCARRYQEYIHYLWCVGGELTELEKRRLRICEVCGCDFIDRSRAGNAKVCRFPCHERKDALRKRVERFSSDQLKRYRERQALEYPFYSPLELFEINKRGETVSAEPERAIDSRRMRQERGKRKPTDITMDTDRVYSPNKYKRWRTEKDAAELAGPVVAYNMRDQPLTEKFTECRRYIGHLSL